MTPTPIVFHHRYTGRTEVEAIYGERWLRWAYESPLGQLSLHALVKRAWFSRWYGWRMDRPGSRRKIAPFLETYRLDPGEFAQPPETFRTFNEFFFRQLRPGARPVHPDPRAVVFPADGRHLAFPSLNQADAFFVKGQRFDLARFLGGDRALLARYSGGAAVFSRLCPVDYHRFHFPVTGTASVTRRIDGWLWSVSPIALRRRLAYLWENRRWLTEIENTPAGRVLMVEIGATNVGSTVYTFTPGRAFPKGAEKGYFRFGGSAVLTLFEPGRVRLCDDLVQHAAEQREVYAHVGDVMAWIEDAPQISGPPGKTV